MKKLSQVISFVFISFMLSLPVMATAHYRKGEPFEMKGSMTHFYGGPKSAEANMWKNALGVCHRLGQGENNGLLLNRLSEVVFSEDNNASSNAQAMFVCLPVGEAY